MFPSKPGLTVLPVPTKQDTIIVYGTKTLEWNDYLGKASPKDVSVGGKAGTTTTTSVECTCDIIADDIRFNYSVKSLFSKKTVLGNRKRKGYYFA